jgi:hypothetical protein
LQPRLDPYEEPFMPRLPHDLFTEPAADPDTLRQLGPLAALAGVWEGEMMGARDVHPTATGPGTDAYLERYELQPIDPQTNGPQLLYGLRYHTHITRPGSVEMFHDQVGYWLWEPATGTIFLTIAIPRGQVAMACGKAAADARTFTLAAERGSTTTGIVSNPFLDSAFTTKQYAITVTIHEDGTWSYEQTTTLQIHGQDAPFAHTDRNTLKRVAAPTPNPLAAVGAKSS